MTYTISGDMELRLDYEAIPRNKAENIKDRYTVENINGRHLCRELDRVQTLCFDWAAKWKQSNNTH